MSDVELEVAGPNIGEYRSATPAEVLAAARALIPDDFECNYDPMGNSFFPYSVNAEAIRELFDLLIDEVSQT